MMTKEQVDRKTIIIDSSFNEIDKKAYWHSRTPGERLEHIERLRQMNYGDKATERLQRIFKIVN